MGLEHLKPPIGTLEIGDWNTGKWGIGTIETAIGGFRKGIEILENGISENWKTAIETVETGNIGKRAIEELEMGVIGILKNGPLKSWKWGI